MHIWFENSISKAIMASGCKCGYLRWTENVESERNKSGSLCARDVNSGCMACVLSSLCKYWRRGKQMIIKISSALLKYVWWENAKCFHTHERKKEKKKEPQQLYGKDTSKLINRQERLRYMKHRDKEGIWTRRRRESIPEHWRATWSSEHPRSQELSRYKHFMAGKNCSALKPMLIIIHVYPTPLSMTVKHVLSPSLWSARVHKPSHPSRGSP